MYDSTGKVINDVSSITAILLTRQLIVVDSYDKRPLSTLPLLDPICVSPDISLVDLLNVFQERGDRNSWRASHLAIVCENPDLANTSLSKGFPIPKVAHVIGIVTMEDVIEELIKENIFDEYDRDEAIDERRAKHAYQKWKRFVEKSRLARNNNSEANVIIIDRSELTTLIPTSSEPTDTDKTPVLKMIMRGWGSRKG
jgi:metal transporter CNNM